ncbi:MAG: PKD domain-containing protein [Candidatus Pacearchaeota archaeon]
MKRKETSMAMAAIVLSLFILLFSFSFSSATVTPGTPFFNLSQTSFGPGQVIEGFLNFSLTDHPGNTIVRATINPGAVTKETTLLNFLKNATVTFNCNPTDCNITYNATNAGTTKTISLSQETEAYYSLVAFGSNVQVQNLSFTMQGSSNAQPVCYETPFKVDLLDDGIIDFEYKEVSGYCPQRASNCFDPSVATQVGLLSTTPSCQKIWLNKTGKVNVSAVLKREGEPQNHDIEFLIYDSNGLLKGSCSVSGWEVQENFAPVSCIIGEDEYGQPTGFYISKADNYFVCVKALGNIYSIKKESQGEICGFYGNPPSSVFTEDYAIYVSEGKFAPFNGEAFFNETTAIGTQNLIAAIQSYLQTKYSNNCSSGCVIPMRFISLASQQVTLNNLNFIYAPGPGQSGTIDHYFYDLTVVPPKLNMTQQLVQLRALNTTAPQQQGSYSISVMIIGGPSGSATFRVEPVPQVHSVYPLTVIPGQSTTFHVVATAPAGRQIVSYIWNWGDGSGEITTTEPTASHIYNQGSYTLTVKVQDNASLVGSKSFTIVANITKELLNTTINSLLARVNAITLQFNALEPWYRDALGLNLSNINSTLLTFKTQLSTATQTQLASMFETVNQYKNQVPLNITDSLILRESPYFVNLENINPQYISEITDETYSSNLEEQYKNAIVLWQEENLDLTLSGQIKTFVYETTSEDKLTVVNIKLAPKTSLNEVYLVFSLPSGVSYSNVKIKQGNFETSDLNDAIGFTFSDLSSSETISLALPGKHDFSQLTFYASPKLAELKVESGTIMPGKEKKAPWGLAIFLMIVIVLVVIAVLWFLWRGYSEKLEKKLFKSPMDLYNLMSFISGAKAKGLRKDEIEEQLLKAGWNKQQINYAWKKLEKQEKAKGKKGKEREIRPLGVGEEVFPYKSIYK